MTTTNRSKRGHVENERDMPLPTDKFLLQKLREYCFTTGGGSISTWKSCCSVNSRKALFNWKYCIHFFFLYSLNLTNNYGGTVPVIWVWYAILLKNHHQQSGRHSSVWILPGYRGCTVSHNEKSAIVYYIAHTERVSND